MDIEGLRLKGNLLRPLVFDNSGINTHAFGMVSSRPT